MKPTASVPRRIQSLRRRRLLINVVLAMIATALSYAAALSMGGVR